MGTDLFRSQTSVRFHVLGRLLKLHHTKFETICLPSVQRGWYSNPLKDVNHCSQANSAKLLNPSLFQGHPGNWMGCFFFFLLWWVWLSLPHRHIWQKLDTIFCYFVIKKLSTLPNTGLHSRKNNQQMLNRNCLLWKGHEVSGPWSHLTHSCLSHIVADSWLFLIPACPFLINIIA